MSATCEDDTKGLDSTQMPTSRIHDGGPQDLGLRILSRQAILQSVDEEVGDGSLQVATPLVAKAIATPNRQLALSKIVRSVTLAHRILATSQVARSVTLAHRILATSQVAQSVTLAHRTFATSQIAQSLTAAHRLIATSGIVQSLNAAHQITASTTVTRSALLTSTVGRRLFETLAPFEERFRFEEVGWFPHSTFPRHLWNWNGDETYSDEMILTHYRKNWSRVSHVIRNELASCDVDFDAKEAIRQALIAHENGLYQLVPPALFAAIEGAVRVCLNDDRVGSISVKDQLLKRVGRLPLFVLPDGTLAIVGFAQLSHHLYENIYTDDVRERFLEASIPNRHAAIHGLVIYSSEKSSLNAIFVAMYVFQILTVLKHRYLGNR